MYKILFHLLLGLLFLSCETDFSDNILEPYPGNKLVLNAILNIDKPVEAQLLHTLPPLEPIKDSLPVVPDAEILFFEDGMLVDTLMYQDNGNYVLPGSFSVESQHSYHFEVSAEGYPSIESIPERMPQRYPIQEFKIIDSVFPCGTCPAPDAAVSISWKADQPVDILFDFEGIWRGKPQNMGEQSYSIIDGETAEECPANTITPDFICRNGEDWTVYPRIRNYRTENDEVFFIDTIHVQVQFLSESYRKFLLSRYQSGGFEGLFLYADNVFSNIEGGYGLVAGSSDTTLVID